MKIIFKIFLLTVAAWFFHFNLAVAQHNPSDKVIDETCDCFKKLNMDTMKDENLRNKGMNCFMTAMTAHITELAGEYGYEVSDLNQQAGEAIGKKIGAKMMQQCPQSVKFFMLMGQQGIQNGDIIPENAEYSSTGTSEGKIIRIEHDGDLTKVIASVDGENETFYWIRPFVGSEKIESDLKSLAGQHASISWGEFQKYTFDMKGYAKVKEITAMKVK